MPWNPTPKLLTHALFQFVTDENNADARAKRGDALPEIADFLRKLHRSFCDAFRAVGWDAALADKHFHAFAEQVCNLKVRPVDQVVALANQQGQKAIDFHAGAWYNYCLSTKESGFGMTYKKERA